MEKSDSIAMSSGCSDVDIANPPDKIELVSYYRILESELMSNQNFQGKTVFITGASNGIGAACAKRFAQAGARLLLCARGVERLQNMVKELQKSTNTELLTLPLDVANREQVQSSLRTLPPAWQTIDVLVNNAGLARGLETLQSGNVDDWEEMIDINIKGLLYVTRAVLPAMVKRNSGHIINLGSVASYHVYPKGAVYCATKHAVEALNQGLRMDLFGTKIRVSAVSPGAVKTDFSKVRFKGDEKRAAAVYEGFEPLLAEDVADAIFYCAACPPHVNVSDILLMPTAQAAATMIHRETD